MNPEVKQKRFYHKVISEQAMTIDSQKEAIDIQQKYIKSINHELDTSKELIKALKESQAAYDELFDEPNFIRFLIGNWIAWRIRKKQIKSPDK